jgi:hypothetical protein
MMQKFVLHYMLNKYLVLRQKFALDFMLNKYTNGGIEHMLMSVWDAVKGCTWFVNTLNVQKLENS